VKRILMVCPGVWDEEALLRPEIAGRYEILREGAELVHNPSLLTALTFDAFRWVRRTVARYRNGRIDGVVGTGDYPGCMLAAAVGEGLSRPSPRLTEVVHLSHKYYSREIQQRLVPEATPRFAAYDPLAWRAEPPLAFPFFTKPVKGTMSIRARLVRSRAEFDESLRFSLRERIGKTLLLRPFEQLLRRTTDRRVPARWFVAESPLAGVQVTVDGFVQDGRATILGVVDSVMYPGTTSFMRFEYPSRLPAPVQARMADLAARLMAGSGFDHSCFNVELFWDEARDALHVIEVNPRMSYQFADLYERVDGTNTFDLQLALATGTPVCFVPRAGSHGAAASFVLRRFRDGRVRSVPTPEALSAAEKRFPGLRVKVLCRVGDRLSGHDQDVGSFRYGIVNLSAPTREALEADWAEVARLLRFDFEDL
jgi:hypothetical protein